MTNFISETSPLQIVGFESYKGRRSGPHPYAERLFKQKYPWLSKVYNPYRPAPFDGYFIPARVFIKGQRCNIECLEYPSNQAALDAMTEFEKSLDDFLSSLRNDVGSTLKG